MAVRNFDIFSLGRGKTAIRRPPLSDGETLQWWALAGVLHSELTLEGISLPQGAPNQTPIHGLNGKYNLASLTEDSARNWPLQGNQVGQKQMTDSELLMDYFDFSGSISPQKEITTNADKEFPEAGKNSNNREQFSPTKETKEKKHRILTKIKTKKWCSNEEIMNIARKYS